MSSRRLLKAAEAIREVVAASILTDIRDPRVENVTVINVDVAPDMREAKVYVSVMGDETQKQLSLRGLQNAAGFLQSKIANRLDTRYTPRLRFEIDRGQENAAAVGEILARIQRERDGVAEPVATSDESGVEATPSDDPTNGDASAPTPEGS
ncbi:30S ribosome-binding factor RbfA [Neorhodopirellula lusitana]|uniref:30S ribosome-binding factor RbfA n=1 Tax=Neorhodopirellula lusitana TaxID=445327 RepID=UPI0024B78C1B|nr:30S ribosome-binding factor RbfA [Neorhodopirellula lusitana]